MKRVSTVLIISVVLSSLIQANESKKYEVKSAKIEYELKGSGEMMGGMVKIESTGTKRLIFDDYGLKELNEEHKVSKNTTMGKLKVDKVHTLNYINGSIVYGVQFKEKRIRRMKNSMVGMASLFTRGNSRKTGEAMLKKMGGKKLGTDNVAGHSCDVWDLGGIKQCLYKGIPLKIESNIMGLKTVEIATKAEFDLSLNRDDFKLPDFPIYSVNMNNSEKKPIPLDKTKLEAMDKKENAQTGEELKDAKTGMKAMGGENSMLAREKQEILEDAKNLPQAKTCFEHAHSVKEANVCERMMDSEDPELHKIWNDTIKANLLKEVNSFEKIVSCVEDAMSLVSFKKCFPRD